MCIFKACLLVLAFVAFDLDLKGQEILDSSTTFLIDAKWGFSVADPQQLSFYAKNYQFGNSPLTGMSGFALFRSRSRPMTIAKHINVRYKLETRLDIGSSGRFIVPEAALVMHWKNWAISFGREKKIIGLNADSLLSLNSFSNAGNSLGIPKIEISVDKYIPVPLTKNWIAFKGNILHGFLGEQKLYQFRNDMPQTTNTYFHQKSLYLKLQKPSHSFFLIGGFNHQVFWGNEKKIFGPNYGLSTSSTFLHVITGTAYGNDSIARSKVGNQLGSIDFAAGLKIGSSGFQLYRQFIYDIGALSRLANIKDGIYGIDIRFGLNKPVSGFKLKRFLFEYMYTKSQAGELGAIRTVSGNENYYNNYIYQDGWLYKGMNIGIPLLTPISELAPGNVFSPLWNIANNRISAFHFGALFQAGSKLEFYSKITYSRNYGTYYTSAEGALGLGGVRDPPAYGIFAPVSQLSGYLFLQRKLGKKSFVQSQCAFDLGKLLHQTASVQINYRRLF